MKKLIFSLLLFIAFVGAKATHITHGFMYYTYRGTETNGDKKYRISLVLFRDCSSSQVEFDNEFGVGVYGSENSVFNLKQSITLTKGAETITTAQSPFLMIKNNVCFRKVVYEKEIVLSRLINEYLVMTQRCCRNTSNNLTDDQGNSFFVNIHTTIDNSSPILFNDAALVTAAGTMASFNLGNFSPDGDSLTYKLVSPLLGASSANPIFDAPPTFSLPVASANFRPGFTVVQPFGVAPAFINIDPATGTCAIKTASTGRYHLAFEVEEWRNNTVINKHYREVIVYSLQGIPSDINTISILGDAAQNGIKGINLIWSHSLQGTIKNFTLQRRLSGTGTWQSIATRGVGQLNYTDSAILYDTAYWYRVYADTTGGLVYSDSVKVGINKGGNNLGQKEINYNKALTIFPNPVGDKLYLELDENKSWLEKISIIDIQGRVVHANLSFSQGISVAHLPAGVYFLCIEGKEATNYQKFIKE